jgi:beta-galactosidase
MCGTYLRTTGAPGEAALTVSAPQTQPVTVQFHITLEEEEK